MTLTNTHRLGQQHPETFKAAGAPSSSRVAPAAGQSQADILAQQCLNLFRQGHDTIEIAKRLNMTEARVSKFVWVARCREKGPATFLRRDRVVARVAS